VSEEQAELERYFARRWLHIAAMGVIAWGVMQIVLVLMMTMAAESQPEQDVAPIILTPMVVFRLFAFGHGMALFIVIVCLVQYIRPGQRLKAMNLVGWSSTWVGVSILGATIMAVTLGPIGEFCYELLQDFRDVERSSLLIDAMMDGSTATLVAIAIGAVIVAPLVEEIAFRLVIFETFKDAFGAQISMAITSVMFAAAHASAVAFVPLLLLGLVLQKLREKAGSLWAPITLHACFNGITVGFIIFERMQG
jgi:membrane protease YdiL (CAAX protease family)